MNFLPLKNGMCIPAGDALVELSDGKDVPGFVRIAGSYAITAGHEVPLPIAQRNAHHHINNVRYQIPAEYRAAAFALTHPNYVVTGFGALALYGLPFLANACDTVLLSPSIARGQPAGPLQPQLARGTVPSHHLWKIRCRDKSIHVASPAWAVVQALTVVRRGLNGWSVLDCGGYEPSFVRAVQLIDASRRHLDIDPLAVLAASRNQLNLKWLTEVLVHSSALADSPKETEMRLIVRRIADEFGLILEEQVPVMRGNRLVTSFDLALIDPVSGKRFGLMYDGAHHSDRGQHLKDAAANLEATVQDWVPIRFDSGTLASSYATLHRYFTRALRR